MAVWEQVEFAQLGLRHEMCVAKQLKSAQHHSESDPTRTKCREGCASDISTHTAPQRERSDTHKVTRGLRGHLLDFHTTLGAPRKMSIENVKTYVLLRSQRLFVDVYNILHLPQKMSPGHPKCCTCHTESSSCPYILGIAEFVSQPNSTCTGPCEKILWRFC